MQSLDYTRISHLTPRWHRGAAIAFLVFVAGCGSSEQGAADQGEPEPLDEAILFQGESACATVTLSSPDGEITSTNTDADSPDDQYDPTGCPHQYVVEVLNTSSVDSVQYGWDVALPTNSTECGQARLFMNWWGWNGTAYDWAGRNKYYGTWNGSTCNWAQDCCYASGDEYLNDANNHTKIRVAVQGLLWDGSSSDYKPVYVRANDI